MIAASDVVAPVTEISRTCADHQPSQGMEEAVRMRRNFYRIQHTCFDPVAVVAAAAGVCTVHDDASHVVVVSIDPLSTVDDYLHDSEIFHGVHHLCLQQQSCPN